MNEEAFLHSPKTTLIPMGQKNGGHDLWTHGYINIWGRL